jgi:hypothetical protein
MDGREYLQTAERLAQETLQADWRTAAGRAYYALMLEGRAALERWGFKIPRRDQIHAFVRLRFFVPADPQLRKIGEQLEKLGRLRNEADYDLPGPGSFADAGRAQQAVQDALDAIALLDAIDADPARRAAAIAAIQKAFPP